MRAELWQRLRLPLRFQFREDRDGFTAVAALPGIETKDLEITFSEDLSTLSVMGLRLPSASEAAQLQRYLETELGSLAIRPEHYLEAGRGAFGRFEETLRLPQEVDVDGITACHERGVLRIQMPRRKRLSPFGTGRPVRAPCDLGASMPPRWPLGAYPGSARRDGGRGFRDSFGFF
nr:small heat shock protein sHsp19.7 [Dinophyceae sp.]